MFRKLFLLFFIVITVPTYTIDPVVEKVDNKVDVIVDNVVDLVGIIVTQTDRKINGLLNDIEDFCDMLINLSIKEKQQLISLIREYPELLNGKIEEKLNKFEQSQKWQNFVNQHDLINRIKKLSGKAALIKLLWVAS